MTRPRAALLMALFAASAALTTHTATGQPLSGETDRLIYRDRAKDGKLEVVVGELKESAAGVEVYGADKKLKQTISPADMVRIEYSNLKNVERDVYAQANQLDAGTDAAKAYAAFDNLVLKAGPAPDERTKRVLTFRKLITAVRANDAKSAADVETVKAAGDFASAAKAADDKYKAAAAILAKELADFSRKYAKNWECWPTARTACRLLAEIGKPDEAALLAKELGDNAALAPDLRTDARLIEVGYQLMTAGRGGASAALAEARKAEATMTDRQKEKVAILAEVLALPEPEVIDAKLTAEEAAARAAAAAKKVRDAVAKVEAAIGKAKDPTARAAGYNAIGEAFLRHGLPRDAMWAFLWVDVVYNQDKDEQLKALDRLVLVYKATGEEEREKLFRERLAKSR